MIEIKEHKIYELLEDQYDRVDLDYVIFSLNENEIENANIHKEAIVNSFNIISKEYEMEITIDESKMEAKKISIDQLLELPPENFYANNKKEKERSFDIPEPLPYWFAFLEPPYGNDYLVSDFIKFNDILIPNKEEIEVYSWNDEFSNYFDAGKEWWGTALWTVLDKKNKTIIVIGASLTD